jgi:hypothetical protein
MGITPGAIEVQQIRSVQRSTEEVQFREIGKKIQAELEAPTRWARSRRRSRS